MAEQDNQPAQDVLAVCLTELWGDWLDEELGVALPTADAPRCSPSNLDPKRRRRVTPKQQIADLQDEVQTLTTRLRKLSERRRPTLRLQSRRPQLWQQISERQQKRRSAAEAENDRLRDMLALQTQEAKNLRRILKRRTRIHMLQNMLGQDQLKQARAPAQDMQDALYSMLRDTELLRLQMDQFFLDKGVWSLPCPGQRRHTDSTTLNGVCFELARREALPFSVDMTKQAVWTALGVLELQGIHSAGNFTADVEFQSQSSDGATSMLSFFAAHARDRTTGVKVRKVVRRYEEDARTVFIYRTVMEPQLDSPDTRVGVYATSTLLIDVQRNASDSESTLLQSHFSATRHDEGLEAGHRLRLSANLDAAIAVWDESIARIHLQVENALLDATFNERSAS